MNGAKIDVLPACRNDHEYGLVSGMCGYEKVAINKYLDVFRSDNE